MCEVWQSRWCTVTSGRSVEGRRSGGSSETTGAATSTPRVTTVTAVNILVTEARPNRVAGVTGTPAARSASPKHSSNSTPFGPVIWAIPDRSSSRSRSARSAMNPTSHTAATDLPASAAARAGSGGGSGGGLGGGSGGGSGGGAGAQPAQRDRAADPVAGPQAGLVGLGVPGQRLDPAALPVPAAGQLQQRRGPVGRPAESRQRGPQLLGALIVPAEPAQRQAQPQPHLRVAARGGPLVEQQRVVVGQLIAQRRREPQREGGIRDGEQGRQLGRQPGAGAGSGSERRQRNGRAVRGGDRGGGDRPGQQVAQQPVAGGAGLRVVRGRGAQRGGHDDPAADRVDQPVGGQPRHRRAGD